MLRHFEDEFHFLIIYKSLIKLAYQQRQLERLIFGYTPVSKFFNLNISGTNRDVVPKQKYAIFPFVGDNIHATPTFEHAWATPGITVIGRFLEI